MHMDKIPSEERGVTQNSWLNSRHTYSFGQYHNLQRLNFGTLRVFNDDIVAPGKGFSTHAHDNMEIITIVLKGSLEHKDSAGNQGVLKAYDVQRMTAGKGIKHSEINPSKSQELHFLQIWVYPEARDLEPSYQQKTFSSEELKNRLCPIVVPIESQDSIFIHQDARIYLGHLEEAMSVSHCPRTKKHGDYLFVIEGEVEVGGQNLKEGDSAQITNGDVFEIISLKEAKLLLIEVSVNTTL